MESKVVFAHNLDYFMRINNKSRKDVADALGVSYFTFTSWVNGTKYPRIDKIEALADYFGILKSDLIEERTDEHCKSQAKNDTLSNIILHLRNDDVFFDTVEKLNTLDEEKLVSVSSLISTFTK